MRILIDPSLKRLVNQSSVPTDPISEHLTVSSQLLIDSYLPDIRSLFSRNKIDYASSLYFVIFGTLVSSLVVSCLTSRHRKAITFFVGFFLLLSYFAIGFGLHDPHWCVGSPQNGTVAVLHHRNANVTWRSTFNLKIGLTHFNISFKAFQPSSDTARQQTDQIELEERFLFAPDMWENDYYIVADAKTAALQRGLPDPILTLAEYFGSDGYGFQWGPSYTIAGDRAKIALQFALAILILSTVLMAVIPFYGLVVFPLVGFLLITSCIIYCGLIPSFHDAIYAQGNLVELQFGHTIFVVLFVGLVDAFFSLLAICLYKLQFIHDVATFFEVDYDTAFDKKTISKDMKDRKLLKSRLQNSQFRKSLRFRSSFWGSKSSVECSPPSYFSSEVIKPPAKHNPEDHSTDVNLEPPSSTYKLSAQKSHRKIISGREESCKSHTTLRKTPVKVHVEFHVEI